MKESVSTRPEKGMYGDVVLGIDSRERERERETGQVERQGLYRPRKTAPAHKSHGKEQFQAQSKIAID